MTKKTKTVIKAVVLVLVIAALIVLAVALSESDGSRLTGGKNGIYGLSGTGMDIDDMVKAAMLNRQNEYERMYKKEVKQEWLKEAYADLYGRLSSFKNDKLEKYKTSSTFAPMHVACSNTSVVTAKANAEALETTHAVSVTALASNGTGASVIIDGKQYSSPENKISVDNVTYSLFGIGESNVTVKMDTDKTIENVRAFVNDYNAILERLNALNTEEELPEYDVLTKEQEAEMSEEQIEKWNKRAKSGLLNGNRMINIMTAKMREAIYTPVTSVDGRYDTTMSIGISTADRLGGLRFDEDKLVSVVREDPDCVYQLFCSAGDDSLTGVKKYNSTGVADRLYDAVTDVLDEIKSYAGTTAEADGSYLGTLIVNLKNKMTNFEEMMNSYREKMYEKYNAMETALSRMNAMFTSLGLSNGSQNELIEEELGGIEEELDNARDEIEEMLDEIDVG